MTPLRVLGFEESEDSISTLIQRRIKEANTHSSICCSVPRRISLVTLSVFLCTEGGSLRSSICVVPDSRALSVSAGDRAALGSSAVSSLLL